MTRLLRRTIFPVILLLAPLFSSYAQTRSTPVSKPAEDAVSVRVSAFTVRIQALSDTLFRIRYSPSGNFPNRASFAVLPTPTTKAPHLERHDTPQKIALSTDKLTLTIDRRTGALSFLDPAGAVISQDMPGFPVEFHGDAFRVYKSMPLNEHYFGSGEKAAPIDHRGLAFTNWNTDIPGWVGGTDPLYQSNPFFLALRVGKAYGIYLDNTYRTSFDFGKEASDMYSFGATGGELDYYFLYGPDPKSVVSQFTELTGHTPLPPRWALGYQQSRYSYYPESSVYDIAHDLREHHIPTDVIYLDIDYLEGHRAFDINRTYFPTFEKMVKDLAQQNFKLVVISDLHLAQLKGYKPYDEAVARDLLVKNPDGSEYVGNVWPGPSVFPEFTLQRARDWYGGLYKDFVQMGVRGFWNDMNEPAIFRYPEKTMPLDTVHRVDDGNGERKTDHREIHNVFGMEQVRATYDGVRKLAPNLRPFILTRAAFAGAQRYAATWTGDNQATWEHYRLTMPTLLSLGISGYAFVGNDVGGFGNSPPPDLVTRWFEVGAFTPLFRDHNTSDSMPKEPWVHGPEQENIRRRYIEERYRLMPYLYTAFEENSRDGLPVMRPLFLEYPTLGDPKQPNGDFVGRDNEFLFGHDLLVAPVPGETLNPIDILLPPGDWFNYWTGQRVAEPHSFKVQPALDEMPVFVRAGAIIPEQPLVQSTVEVPQGPLELRVYPGPDCKGSLYWDDGETFDFQKGQYYRQSFSCSTDQHGLTVDLRAVEGDYQPWWKSIAVVVYGDRPAKSVTINGTNTVQSVFAGGANRFEVPASRSASKIEIAF